MLQWQREFLAQLRSGVPAEKACRSAAGKSLADVMECKETDAEFSNAWDDITDPEGGRGRQTVRHLTGQSLEALLWSQCTDEQTAAYFNLEVAELMSKINADPELKRIYKLGRLAGQAQILMHQSESAAAGHVPMQMWLGKQYIGQAEKIDHHATIETKPMDTTEIARRLMFVLAENKIPLNQILPTPEKTEVIDVQPEMIDDDA